MPREVETDATANLRTIQKLFSKYYIPSDGFKYGSADCINTCIHLYQCTFIYTVELPVATISRSRPLLLSGDFYEVIVDEAEIESK